MRLPGLDAQETVPENFSLREGSVTYGLRSGDSERSFDFDIGDYTAYLASRGVDQEKSDCLALVLEPSKRTDGLIAYYEQDDQGKQKISLRVHKRITEKILDAKLLHETEHFIQDEADKSAFERTQRKLSRANKIRRLGLTGVMLASLVVTDGSFLESGQLIEQGEILAGTSFLSWALSIAYYRFSKIEREAHAAAKLPYTFFRSRGSENAQAAERGITVNL